MRFVSTRSGLVGVGAVVGLALLTAVFIAAGRAERRMPIAHMLCTASSSIYAGECIRMRAEARAGVEAANTAEAANAAEAVSAEEAVSTPPLGGK